MGSQIRMSYGEVKVFSPESICAVIGCENNGRRQICPIDRRNHHHGRVHYDTWPSSLSFRDMKDGWFLMCDGHFATFRQEAIYRQEAI